MSARGRSSMDPVRLPPGRARLEMRPAVTGSSASVATIGMVRVACSAATWSQRSPAIIITSTPRPSNSANIAGAR